VPHLLTFRKGWENERLAAYLLSRFSFVAQPTSIADDLGSDFFCTIFEIQDVSGRDALTPRSSFAIQVKSSASEVSADNKIEYLMRLEMPFFIGVVSQSPPEMNIYSAEFLSLLFAEFGQPNKLSLIPVDGSTFDPIRYYERTGPGEVQLYCPLVATLGVDDDRPTLAPKVDALLDICTRARGNIATRVSEEHIYDVDGRGNLRIVAGSGSFRFFRSNFLKRLGEIFQNLLWLHGASPSEFPMTEFQTFESLYNSLEGLYGALPSYVSEPYRSLKARLTGQSV
jgi:hypothetical protein